jgi:hypothetical protein
MREIASAQVQSRVIVNVRKLVLLQNCSLRIRADLLRYSVEGRTHVSASGLIQTSSHLCFVCGRAAAPTQGRCHSDVRQHTLPVKNWMVDSPNRIRKHEQPFAH